MLELAGRLREKLRDDRLGVSETTHTPTSRVWNAGRRAPARQVTEVLLQATVTAGPATRRPLILTKTRTETPPRPALRVAKSSTAPPSRNLRQRVAQARLQPRVERSSGDDCPSPSLAAPVERRPAPSHFSSPHPPRRAAYTRGYSLPEPFERRNEDRPLVPPAKARESVVSGSASSPGLLDVSSASF